MRKHASSWLVKTVLGLIILTFILFFGYSKLADRYQDSHQYIAHVGDVSISRKKYEINLEATIDRFRKNMKDTFPEGLRSLVEQNVLQQLIQRELMTQYAAQMPLSIRDQDVAQAIQEDKNIFPDGKFDLLMYREKFLPFYRNAYGENFEDVIRRQLLLEKMGIMADQLFNPWHDELEKSLTVINNAEKAKTKTVKGKAETQPETQQQVSSVDATGLFTIWLDRYREKVKVETFLKR